jgi:hypothetical protein
MQLMQFAAVSPFANGGWGQIERLDRPLPLSADIPPTVNCKSRRISWHSGTDDYSGTPPSDVVFSKPMMFLIVVRPNPTSLEGHTEKGADMGPLG